jgi:hypothetical protein
MDRRAALADLHSVSDLCLSPAPVSSRCVLRLFPPSVLQVRNSTAANVNTVISTANYTTAYPSRPEPALNNLQYPLNWGNMWGGSSGHYRELAVRGSRPRYDQWAQLTGNPTWAYEKSGDTRETRRGGSAHREQRQQRQRQRSLMLLLVPAFFFFCFCHLSASCLHCATLRRSSA